MKSLFAACVAALSMALPAVAAPPVLNCSQPAGIPAGRQVEVAFLGTDLKAPLQLWSSLPLESQELVKVDEDGRNAVFKLKLPAGASGYCAIRLASGEGVTSPVLLMIDDLATLREQGEHATLDAAQSLELPLAVEGVCEAEACDFYRFGAKAGQRVSVEVVARRIGSPLDGVVRLLDASGQELAYSDDDAHTGADGRLSYRFASDGEYYLELRDISYQGSSLHRYRLRLGDFPLATAAYPLGVAAGSSTRLEVPLAGPLASVEQVDAPASSDVGEQYVAVGAGDQGFSYVRVVRGAGPEQVELEPNDTPESAAPLLLEGAMNGRLQAEGDVDCFQLAAKKGDTLCLVGRTRALGSPVDLYVRLYDAEGKQLAEVDDASGSDGGLTHRFAADGKYTLMVEDLHRGGGDGFTYRLEVCNQPAGFTLVVDGEKYNVPHGGVMAIKVTAQRTTYQGPIQLVLEGLPAGATVRGNVIAEKKNDATLQVTIPADLPSGTLLDLRVVGRAGEEADAPSAVASTRAPLAASLGGLINPPAALDGQIAVGVGGEYPAFLELAVEPGEVMLPQVVGAARFKVKVKKLNKFDGEIKLALRGLPAGVTATVPAIAKGKSEATVELAMPAALAPGEFQLTVIASATHELQPKQFELTLPVRIVPPLELSLAVDGRLPAGDKRQVQVKVERHCEPGPVEVRFSWPRGIQGPQSVSIAPDKSEASVEVQAAADASPGAVVLVGQARVEVGGRAVSVRSLPVALEVIAAAKPQDADEKIAGN